MLRSDFRHVVIALFGIILANRAVGQSLGEHGLNYDKPATFPSFIRRIIHIR
jgi:hypothetical protein